MTNWRAGSGAVSSRGTVRRRGETHITGDVEELPLNWIEGKVKEARTIYETSFPAGRLLTLRSRLGAAYKALKRVDPAMVLKAFPGSRRSKVRLWVRLLDIHHIFPQRI